MRVLSVFGNHNTISCHDHHHPNLTSRHTIARAQPAQSPYAFPIHTDVLIIDATNVLCRAALDAKKEQAGANDQRQLFAAWVSFLLDVTQPGLSITVFDEYKKGGSRWRDSIEPNYFRQRKKRNLTSSSVETNTSNSKLSLEATSTSLGRSGTAEGYHPYTSLASTLGCISITSTDGNEADDVIAALSSHLSSSSPYKNNLERIVIASGDADMQRNLSERVDWVKILGLATAACPAGVELVTMKEFEKQHGGLKPELYGELLALSGKKEAGLGGIGLSSSTAARLLNTYGSIDSIFTAAQQGKLKGWGPAAVHALAAPESLGRLVRNRQLLANPIDPSILLASDLERIHSKLEAYMKQKQSQKDNVIVGDDGVTALAWSHPMHARRWQQVESTVLSLTQILQRIKDTHSVEVKTATPGGLPIDLLISNDEHENGIAVFIAPGARSRLKEEGPPKNGSQELLALVEDILSSNLALSKTLLKQLSPAMQHHIGLVKRAGYKPLIVPNTIPQQF